MAELQEFTEIPAKIRSCSKNVLYLSVKVIGTELLIENTFLRLLIETTPLPPTHTHTPVFEWPFEPHESLVGPVPGIKPATFSFRSVKKIGVLSEQYSLLYDWIC